MSKLLSAIFVWVLSMLLVGKSLCQQLEYDIVWLGKVGKLNISKTTDAKSTQIETISEVKIPFYKLNWITDARIVDGQLQSSNYSQLLNEKKNEFMEITQISDSSWQVASDNGNTKPIKIHHPFFVSQLYFTEPKDIDHVFSERFAQSLKLIDQGNGHYKLLLPDGNHCEYFYESGLCKLVKAKNGSKTIKMVLVDPNM